MSAAAKARARHDDPSTGVIVPNEASGRFRPRSDNALVLMDFIRDMRSDEKTASGLLYVPRTEKPDMSKPVMATVIDVGEGAWVNKNRNKQRGLTHDGKLPEDSQVFIRPEFRKGDRVLVQHGWCGDALMVDGLEHRIIKFDNVIGVIEEGE